MCSRIRHDQHKRDDLLISLPLRSRRHWRPVFSQMLTPSPAPSAASPSTTPSMKPDQGMGRRLHQGDRHQGHAAQRQRHGIRQPDRAGRRGLAGRRVPDREFAGHGAGRSGRPVRAVDADTLAQVPAELPAGQRPLDRHRRAQHGVRLQQDEADAGPIAEIDAGSRRRRAGRAAGPPRRPAPISRRSSARCWS